MYFLKLISYVNTIIAGLRNFSVQGEDNFAER